LHWVGGIPITPYHIWRYIQQNVGLNVDSWQYDILYGTGPDILLSRTAGVDMTMIPFLAGNSYRGITLQNSFFYGAVRPGIEDGSLTTFDPNSDVVPSDAAGINGRIVYMVNYLHNYGTTPINVTVYFDYDIWWWDFIAQAWSPLTPALKGDTHLQSQLYTIPAGKTQRIVNSKVATIPAAVSVLGMWFAIHESMHWTYTYGDHNWVGFWGDYTGHTPEEPAYWSDIVVYHAGDHIGRAPLPPTNGYWDIMNEYSERYLSANGLVNIGDVGPITANWQQPAPASTDIGINNADGIKKRADLDGNGILAIGDVGLITAVWQQGWTDNPPAFPTTGP
jgi:hypothetical protein